VSDSARSRTTSAVYSTLIDRLCELNKATLSPSRHDRCELAIEGTSFTLTPSWDANGDIDGMAYFVDLGPLPQHQREAVALRLLGTNLFMVARDAPSFCFNPQAGHVVLAGYLSIDRGTAESVFQVLTGLAHFAAQWDLSQSLPSQGPVPGAGAGSAPRMPSVGA